MAKSTAWAKSSALISLIFVSSPVCQVLAHQSDPFDASLQDALTLLQLRASAVGMLNVTTESHVREDPGQREREQCPHELEAELDAQGAKRYGCDGSLQAQNTVVCSWWGDPHVTNLFTGKLEGFDILYKSGLLRAAAAADGSWEVQIFNCGVFASAVAARFGKDLMEVWIDADGIMVYQLNGVKSDYDSLPIKLKGVTLEKGHRSIHTDVHDYIRNGHIIQVLDKKRAGTSLKGACIDDPGGQVNIDIAQGDTKAGWFNLNVKIEARSDAVTTVDTDSYSLCNLRSAASFQAREQRWLNWEVEMVKPEDSLFTLGTEMCAGCNGKLGWSHLDVGSAPEMCAAHPEKDVKEVTLGSVCRGANNGAGIDVDEAADVCGHLIDKPLFFQDCQIDYCMSDGNKIAAALAEGEEALENPQPMCVGQDEECDPSSKCCNALKDEATLNLDNVVTNKMCSGGELRFGSALRQNGQSIDMVVKPVGNMNCGGHLTDSKFGARTSQIGYLGVRAKTSQAFEFSFVQEGTNNPVVPQSLMLSFLDLDQGKNGKQQESVEVCGGAMAVVTGDTELDIDDSNAECIKVTSSTHGTGRDNPETVESMSQMQRARVAAFEVKDSIFRVTLAVSGGGRNARKFQFAGHPSVACTLK